MKDHCVQNLNEINNLIRILPEHSYRKPCDILSGATIGQHVRHILEFYGCLLSGVDAGRINYDGRERNRILESHPDAAIEMIDQISTEVCSIKEDAPILLSGNYDKSPGYSQEIGTTLFRELAYCLEHSIHHQALIKVSLIEQGLSYLVQDTFGVAPATVRYREHTPGINQCRLA